MPAHRVERINSVIQREVSELLQREVKDPRLDKIISVTDVQTSHDLKYAKIFVSCLNGEQEKEKTLKALTRASGFLRSQLTKSLKMRVVPELSFHWDDSLERGARISALIDKVLPEDNDIKPAE